VSQPVSKEQIFAKLQEFDSILQAAVNVRTELWSMIAKIPDNLSLADIEIPLTFYDNGNVIAWGNDSERFTPSTFRFVQQLYLAPNRTLSIEDVRQDVQGDEESKPGSIWACISRVRQELKSVDFPYTILTQRGKGYRLVKM
jgi:DNA-binding response OmpR family regulator